METPVIFEFPFRVAAADIDRMGHVNNVVYLRYAQDAAVAHWRAAVPEDLARGTAWVVRRHEIDYLRPAFEGDELVSKTWIGTADGATFERFVEILRPKDACVLARVRTVWVALDPKSQRPKRVTPDLLAPFRR